MKQQNYTFSKDYLACIAQAWLFTYQHDEKKIQADDVFLWVWKYLKKSWYAHIFWMMLWNKDAGKVVDDFVSHHYTQFKSPPASWKMQFQLDPFFQSYFDVYKKKGMWKLNFLVLFIASLDKLSPDVSWYLTKHGMDISFMKWRVEQIIDTTLSISLDPLDFFKMVKSMVESLWLDVDQMDMFFDLNSLEDMEVMMWDQWAELVDPQGWSEESNITVDDKKDDDKKLTIEYFATDLTQEAKNWYLDPVIGRAKEIQQIIFTLMRKTKNNPLLIWEAWVWKTAIVEWLAQKIHENDVPQKLKNKRLMMLDIWSLVAWTKYRGEFEARLKSIIEEAMDPMNNIILFVDEVHTLIWAGNAEWSADAANMLKPLLSRGKIQMIWATTFDEYQKHIEKDPALKRRFQEITVEEPSQDEALEILTGLRERFEEFHGVSITDWALDYAVKYSVRYMMNKHLPDKAIDLIDEACARVSTLSQKLEKNDEYAELEQKVKDIQSEIEACIEKQDYFKAAELKDAEEEYKKELKVIRNKNSLPKHLRASVDVLHVGKVLSDKMWLPLEQVTSNEIEQLAHLDEDLKEYILAQDEAVDAVVKSIRRRRLSPVETKKPIASFVFLWPSWVGKTYLAKLLAKEYFGDDKALIRIDMSEFMEKYSVSKLVWSAPWYVWYEEWGILTEQVRRKPYSVVLFDEIEKASPEIMNIMLQILDEGHLKDNKWRWIDFKNTIIIMTSNIWASEFWLKQVNIWFDHEEEEVDMSQMQDREFQLIKERVLDEVKDFLTPELINRLTDMIVFRPLSKEVMSSIFQKELKSFLSAWKKKSGLNLPRFGKRKIEKVIDEIYDPQLWARPISRYIHDEVEGELIDQMMSNALKK